MSPLTCAFNKKQQQHITALFLYLYNLQLTAASFLICNLTLALPACASYLKSMWGLAFIVSSQLSDLQPTPLQQPTFYLSISF